MELDQDDYEDKRADPRRRVVKSGKIVFNNHQSIIDCSVRDLSEGGAKLLFPGGHMLPREFDLHLSDGRVMKCEVRWAKDNAFGVKFA